MRVWILTIGLCFLNLWVEGQHTEALQQLLQTKGLKNAAIGVEVKQVSDGKKVIEYCSDMALTPASVAKLLPSWFALQKKGSDYRYQTLVGYTGKVAEGVLEGNIFIKAGGDPCLDSRYFPQYSFLPAVAEAIQCAGIRCIRGQIEIRGAVKGTDIPGSWPWEDVSNYYAALYLPFNYRDNTFVLQLQSGRVGTSAKLVSVVPDLPGIEIKSEVKVADGNKEDVWIYGGPYSTEMYVKGTVPAGHKIYKVRGAVSDPASVFIRELETELKKKNITVEGKLYPEVPEERVTELLRFSSPRLEEIIFHTNKSSVNLFAEALGKLTEEENWLEEAKELLLSIGVDVSGMILKDACGLSPMNALPARIVTDLLVYAGRKEAGAFLNSLPVAGEDGGLNGYCHSFPQLKNKLRAKTGSMTGVRGLAGYIINRKGETFAFCILVNHYTCTTSQLQYAIGKFLTSLL